MGAAIWAICRAQWLVATLMGAAVAGPLLLRRPVCRVAAPPPPRVGDDGENPGSGAERAPRG